MRPHPTTDKTARLARSLYEEALAAGAERLVFRRDEEIFSAPVDVSDIARALVRRSPKKYKFQASIEGRWVDRSQYALVSGSAKAIIALRDGDLEAAGSLSPATVARAAATEPDAFAVALRGLHSRIFERLNRDLLDAIANRTVRFFEQQPALSNDSRSNFVHATADLYNVIANDGLRGVLRGASASSTIARVEARVAEDPERFGREGAEIAVANVLGKLLSFKDREAAALQFGIVRRLDERGLMEHFHLETGSKTYFAPSEVAATPPRAKQLRNSIEPMEARAPQNSFGILIGMDSAFYRTYAPMLRFYAQQLPDIDFNFLVCGTPAEAESVVSDGAAYSTALARLNHSGAPVNIHHFRMAVPSFVQNKNTFYASARFFAAEMMVNRYSSAYLMDADLTTDVDPRPYFRRVEELTFGAPSMSGFTALYPWRRYLAGNVVMSKRILETSVLDDLQTYLAYGLSFSKSWTLDQNALAFAIERNPQHYTDLRSFNRPFYQPKFRMAWERRHREMTTDLAAPLPRP